MNKFFRLFMAALIVGVGIFWYSDSSQEGYSFLWEGFAFLVLELFFVALLVYATWRDNRPNLNKRG